MISPGTLFTLTFNQAPDSETETKKSRPIRNDDISILSPHSFFRYKPLVKLCHFPQENNFIESSLIHFEDFYVLSKRRK